ncbi:MAG: CheR family methyltransferase [Pseudomonadota bacterium]
MSDAECMAFLQWALPLMGFHWPGFRKVRGRVCKRIARRCAALGLADASAYRRHLEAHGEEWDSLRALCAVAISRFYRDRGVFQALEASVLPRLAPAAARRPDATLACWSVGCASGEEPYTLAILWQLQLAQRHPQVALDVLATDVDPALLARAAAARYQWSSVKALPESWRSRAFEQQDGDYRLRAPFRDLVRFELQDVRESVPGRDFDLILCRNLVLTYFAPALRRQVMARILARLREGGALVVGMHESLPEGMNRLAPWPGVRAVFRKGTAG